METASCLVTSLVGSLIAALARTFEVILTGALVLHKEPIILSLHLHLLGYVVLVSQVSELLRHHLRRGGRVRLLRYDSVVMV